MSTLQEENAHLRRALASIDHEVDRAAGKWLHSTVPHGKLKFGEFLDLLALEIRRQLSEEHRIERHPSKVATKLMSKFKTMIDSRVEESVGRLVEQARGRMDECFRIKIILLPGRKVVSSRASLVTGESEIESYWRAVSIYGAGPERVARAKTPESACDQLQERLLLDFFRPSSIGNVMDLFRVRDNDIYDRWLKAKPFRADRLGSFHVDARIEE